VDAQSQAIVMGNRAICDMLGYELEELMRLGIADITPAAAHSEVQRQFERQANCEILVAPDLPVQRKDGSVFFADVSGGPPMLLGGRSLMVGIVHDITERKQADEQIRKLNRDLEGKVEARTRQLIDAQDELVRKEKLALLGQVAGSVGHELRNPLGVMNNAVYFLQTVLTDADATTREYLEIIKVEIAEADRIVADLLDSVRTRPPHPAAVGVREVIDQTLRQNPVPAAMTVTLEIPATLPPVWVDAMQIQQVFRNLISNGVEAMADGGTLAIGAVENSRDGMVSVSVCDSGSGMPPEVQAKLFQPLFTTKARGIGLGLVVAKNLTEINNGRIEVQSEPGKGAMFSIILPGKYEEGCRHG
jgi:PAS domain S-box-containing protein